MEQRPLPHRVPDQEKSPGRRVVHRERIVADNEIEAALLPAAPGVEQDLGIATALRTRAAGPERRQQFVAIVEADIGDEEEALVPERLIVETILRQQRMKANSERRHRRRANGNPAAVEGEGVEGSETPALANAGRGRSDEARDGGHSASKRWTGVATSGCFQPRRCRSSTGFRPRPTPRQCSSLQASAILSSSRGSLLRACCAAAITKSDTLWLAKMRITLGCSLPAESFQQDAWK